MGVGVACHEPADLGAVGVLAGDLVLSPGREERTASWLNPILAPLAAELDPRPRLEVVGRDEVGVISWTGVRAPGTGPAAERPALIDLTGEPEGGAPAPPAGSDRQEVAT